MQQIKTWKNLLEALQSLSSDELEQPVQICEHHPVYEYVYPLKPAVCFGTVDELGLCYVRSSVDNKRHGNELLIYTDFNPYAVDGAVAYEFVDSFDNKKPIYPEDYDPQEQDWTGLAQKNIDKSKSSNIIDMILINRQLGGK